jgi:hypothetical protein
MDTAGEQLSHASSANPASPSLSSGGDQVLACFPPPAVHVIKNPHCTRRDFVRVNQ